MNITKEYQRWCENKQLPLDLQSELKLIEDENDAIKDRFYRDLEFGTGGLRGVIGIGTNRMNVYTVAKATQGYSQYLLEQFTAPSVAVAYDSRNKSKLFAETAAAVFATNGIQVFLYSILMPTPALSFAVRYLNCSGGIVITASHNPAKYNGYKVYNDDGCQITLDAADKILEQIGHVDIFEGVKEFSFDQQLAKNNISYIHEDVTDAYLKAVSKESFLAKSISKDVSIVYTPLNGAGISCVPRCLKENGFSNITIPAEQTNPDGDFPTCPFPNPEIKETLDVAIQCARSHNSDLVLATDPDCDRVGVAVKNGEEYVLISGNQMGVLLLDFICQMRRENQTMPTNPIAVKTIVTTPMAEKVATHYGVELVDVLTGFKFIGEQIGLLEQNEEDHRYIFGFEESYGYLSGSFVRDKDAVNASLLICEMFTYYQSQGLSLLDRIGQLYQQHGAYSENLLSFTFEGAKGAEQIKAMVTSMRQNPPEQILDCNVSVINDYLNSLITLADGTTTKISLPSSDVISIGLENGVLLTVRPSGTEPKLKIYISSTGKTVEDSIKLCEELSDYCNQWVSSFQGDGE